MNSRFIFKDLIPTPQCRVFSRYYCSTEIRVMPGISNSDSNLMDMDMLMG